MNTPLDLQQSLAAYVDRRSDRLITIARELIRRPSENIPPGGAEKACQTWIANTLSDCGLTPDLYTPDEVAGIHEHPLFFPGRDYAGRQNLGARRKGTGGGKSLLLSGHIDTVPRGTQDWQRDAFGGEIEGKRLYGRGSNDMKAGVAINLFVFECVEELDLSLSGDLLFETVVDEEFGGSNGTLAGRLRGYNADAAVLTEPSSLRICPAQRGGRTAHITFRATAGGVLQNSLSSGIAPQVSAFLSGLASFASGRSKQFRRHEMYADHTDPVPVSITKIFTAPWGYGEPITIPESAKIELYWQLMPGETQAEVENEFFHWLEQLVESFPETFTTSPEVEFPFRWLPGSSISRTEPIIRQLSECATAVLGTSPTIAGIEGPCDLFVFQQGFGIPAVIWGPAGGNTHAADEYVETDSMISAAKALLLLVAEWCGIAKA